MTTFKMGLAPSAGASDQIILTGQTVDVSMVPGDPTYKDAGGTWKKATAATLVPEGVVGPSANSVVTFGRASLLSGLNIGSMYYLAATGGLTLTQTTVKIGVAFSATELLVDIDTDATAGAYAGKAAYIAGGYNSGQTPTRGTTTEKLTFATEIVNSQGVTISNGRANGMSHVSSSAGYVAGGFGVANLTYVDKMPFATEVYALIAGRNSNSCNSNGASASSSSAGYTLSGQGTVVTESTNRAKMPFSTEVTALLSAAGAQARLLDAGTQSSTAAYSGGGQTADGSGQYSSIDRMVFSTETTTNNASSMTRSGSVLSACSSLVAGYYHSNSSPNSTLMNKLTFATDTAATVNVGTAALTATSSGGATASSTAGYIIMGSSTGGTILNKLAFVSDTVALSTAQLVLGRVSPFMFANLS
jgi:hypothetical protein